MLKIIFYIFFIIGIYTFLFCGYTGIVQLYILFLIIFSLIYANINHDIIVIE